MRTALSRKPDGVDHQATSRPGRAAATGRLLEIQQRAGNKVALALVARQAEGPIRRQPIDATDLGTAADASALGKFLLTMLNARNTWIAKGQMMEVDSDTGERVAELRRKVREHGKSKSWDFTDLKRQVTALLADLNGEPLTTAEVAEKKKQIAYIVDYLQPARPWRWWGGGAAPTNLAQYQTKLVAKILWNERLLRSIKGKDPYVEHPQDDSTTAGGMNDTLIREVAADRRSGGDFEAERTPGEAAATWQSWQDVDCVFAAILQVVQGGPANERAREEAIADEYGLARGIVPDPVLLLLMERIGWTYVSGVTWNSVDDDLDTGNTYVMSYDRDETGTSSHVVVLTHDGDGWEIYDRQANRRHQDTPTPEYADNPVDIWLVPGDVSAIRDAIS